MRDIALGERPGQLPTAQLVLSKQGDVVEWGWRRDHESPVAKDLIPALPYGLCSEAL